MTTLKREAIIFALAGTAGFLVDASTVLTLSNLAAFDLVSAKLVGFAVAVTVTWIINRNVTFAHRKDERLLREWTRYVSANSFGGLINNGIYMLLVFTWSLPARYPVLAVAAGSLAGMMFNFVSSRCYVFVGESVKPQVAP